MLTFIKDLSNKLLEFIKDDPVRPEIPTDFRVSEGRFVAALVHEEKPTTAVFYTIWSYQAGKGRELLIQAVREIQKQQPSVTTFVTLSPKTETARRFHLRNGAIVFRENVDTVNYQYTMLVKEEADDK